MMTRMQTVRSSMLGPVKLVVASALAVALAATCAPSATADPGAMDGGENEQLVEMFQPEAATEEGLEALTLELAGEFNSSTLDGLISPTVELPVGVNAPRGYATDLPELGEEIGLSGGALEDNRSISIAIEGSSATSVTDGVAIADPDAGTGQKAFAHTTANGGQIMYLIEDQNSEPDATFSVDAPLGASWVTLSDGGLELRNSIGDPLVTVEKPWAVDATGQHLPTRFETGDGYFRQIVDTEGATYPVVADPSVAWYAKKAVLCLANIAAFGSIAAKAASVGAKIYKRLKAAKTGTQLHKAFQAWKKLGGSNGARAKALWSTLKEFAKQVKNVGFAKAKHKVEIKGTKFKYGIIVLFGAAGIVGDVLGVNDCVALVKGREV